MPTEDVEQNDREAVDRSVPTSVQTYGKMARRVSNSVELVTPIGSKIKVKRKVQHPQETNRNKERLLGSPEHRRLVGNKHHQS